MDTQKVLNMLWKKESSDPNALYVDILGKLNSEKVTNDSGAINVTEKLLKDLQIPVNPKLNDVAKMYKEAGNQQFAERKWLYALYHYNLTLGFAEPGSEILSLAYANRSSCFLRLKMYKECLADIDSAIKANYPAQLLPKLEKRREDCLQQMNGAAQNEEIVPKLDFEVDPNFPGMANVLQIERNQKYGRHITSKCDIGAGKTILVEEAYVHQLRIKEWRVCSTCSKVLTNLIPCDRCSYAMFCNNECKEKNNIHKMECDDIGLNIVSKFPHYTARSIFAAISSFDNVNELILFVEEFFKDDDNNRFKEFELPQSLVDKKSKYRAFLQQEVWPALLQPNVDVDIIKTLTMLAHNAYNNLLCRNLIKKGFNTKQKQRFLMHLTVYHCILLYQINMLRGPDTAITKHSLEVEYNGAVFFIQPYLKHSCIPNVVLSNHGNLSVAKTIRSIKKGEQLFVYNLPWDRRLLTNEYRREYCRFA